jgi:hypothetical protein
VDQFASDLVIMLDLLPRAVFHCCFRVFLDLIVYSGSVLGELQELCVTVSAPGFIDQVLRVFYSLIAAESKRKPSYLGIGLLVAVAVVRPWLARLNRVLADATSSSALRADSAQSSICSSLSWIALAGLVLNAIVTQSERHLNMEMMCRAFAGLSFYDVRA